MKNSDDNNKKNGRPRLKPVFLNTKNVRNYEAVLDSLEIQPAEGGTLRPFREGRLAAVIGNAGLGKSRTTVYFAANNGWPYLQVSHLWSETEFLRALCRELGINPIPKRKGPCFGEVVERLLLEPRPLFLDDFHKFGLTSLRQGQAYLETALEISDFTGCPVVLVGEEDLAPMMRQNKRCWSRTFQKLNFQPIEAADIIKYAELAASMRMSAEVGLLVQKKSRGDFRPVKRAMAKFQEMGYAVDTAEITIDMAQTVLKMDLWGEG